MEQVLGHAPGERIVSHAEMLHYLDALVEARPQQIQVHEYAQSWEGRALVYAVIGSVENIQCPLPPARIRSEYRQRS